MKWFNWHKSPKPVTLNYSNTFDIWSWKIKIYGFILGPNNSMGQGTVLVNFRDTSESLSLILKRSENRQEKP